MRNKVDHSALNIFWRENYRYFYYQLKNDTLKKVKPLWNYFYTRIYKRNLGNTTDSILHALI